MHRERRPVREMVLCILLLLALTLVPEVSQAQRRGGRGETSPTLGLEQGTVDLQAPGLQLSLVRASQTVAALRPESAPDFDFTPGRRLEQRAFDLNYHLGDVTLMVRPAGADGEWRRLDTAQRRRPVESLEAEAPVLAAADLAATLPEDAPVGVRRFWEVDNGVLALRFEVTNRSDAPLEIGAFGMPLVFNNILDGHSLDDAHAICSFHDPYIGSGAGYLQVIRLNGQGPVLLVVPQGDTRFEAYNPLLRERTGNGITFEGFYEWLAHSRAYAETDWREADPWNPPTSVTLAPGESTSYGLRFLLADSIRDIETALAAHGRPVAVGVPGYVLPMDLDGRLFLKYPEAVESIAVEPAGAITISEDGDRNGWQAYHLKGNTWGRARVTVTYADGLEQTIHYKVIKPAAEVVANLGNFLMTEQWFEREGDPFGRSPSVISYDYDEKKQVTEEVRAWIAGLGDEGGSGSWLAAIMKQLVQPDPAQIAQYQRFVDEVIWGGLQYNEGDQIYGVRKSMFYYEPEQMPEGTYSESVPYGGWMSWNLREARSTGRSYNYPHVAALHWVLYRLARNHEGLVTNHEWDWYLRNACQTGLAMTRQASGLAQFGQMEGTVFLLILQDLQREGWTDEAVEYEAAMRARAEHWNELNYPYGSEMPWDSTGQEEVYAWTKYFGFDQKADVTLNAILAYMPTVPHWGYNGSARRYWDFVYAGKLTRVERQLHHYGSGLNAIPVLSRFREQPDDFYLLRVGHGGMMGAIANITQDGFGPCGFHAYPSTLEIDGYSGDFGPSFFGHAVNAGTYLTHHEDFGWLGFGGNVREEGSTVTLTPLDSARQRVYLATLGLWLTLDAGTFESVQLNTETSEVTVRLSGATPHTPVARLRIEQPARADEVGTFRPVGIDGQERGAWLIDLSETTSVTLRRGV